MSDTLENNAVRSERFNLRATTTQADLILSGAKIRGMNTTQYILESTCRQAEHDLADQRHFSIPEDKMKAFLKAIDRSTQDKPALRELLNTPSILER